MAQTPDDSLEEISPIVQGCQSGTVHHTTSEQVDTTVQDSTNLPWRWIWYESSWLMEETKEYCDEHNQR